MDGNYYHGANINHIDALKQELTELLEDAKYDKLRIQINKFTW